MDDGEQGGPFAGVPFLLKDVAAICAGLPVQFGSRFLEEFSGEDLVYGAGLRLEIPGPVGAFAEYERIADWVRRSRSDTSRNCDLSTTTVRQKDSVSPT